MAQNVENEADFKESKTIDEENCFKQRENTADEVVLTFDDGQTMYVSASFLSYASPVFKAMFQHDFKEKETREVKLTGKVYDDFHEFLLFHPGVQRPVDRKNVLQIVSIADEYHVSPSITKCKKVMSDWLKSEIKGAATGSINSANYPRARTCFNILKKADACSFKEITDLALKTVARFGHKVFTGTATNLPPSSVSASAGLFGTATAFGTTTTPSSTSGFSLFGNSNNRCIQEEVKLLKPEEGKPKQLDDPKADCKVMFDSLPECLKTSLLLARLDLCDDGNLR